MNPFHRYCLIVLLCSLTSMTAWAGELSHLWSQRFGDSYWEYGQSVAVDRSGNVFIMGRFHGTLDFGGELLTSAGGMDIFLAKFDTDGNHLWSQRFGDTNDFDYVQGIAVDGAGNVLITGYFYGTLDFGGGLLTSTETDIFLAKFDPGGNHIWSHGFGDYQGSGDQRGRSVAVDGAGNVFLTGDFEGIVDFNGGLQALGIDIFLVKFDPDGNHIWSQRFGDFDGQVGTSVAVDGAGNVLLTGSFGGTVDFGGGPLTSAGGGDIFQAKFDPSGNHLWSQRFGDSHSEGATCISMDIAGNALLTGYFRGTIDFGGGPLTSAGGETIFLAKFDASGNHTWSQRFGDWTNQRGMSVAADGAGSVILTGYFGRTVDFGGGPLRSAGDDDIFLAEFDPDGLHLWSQRFGDWFRDRGNGVAVDRAGNVIFTGSFWLTADFGGDPLESEGYSDIFLAKLESRAPSAALLSHISATPSPLRSFPNPAQNGTTIRFSLDRPGPVRLLVYDAQGRLLRRLIDEHLDSGTQAVAWDGLDANGHPVPSGIYVYHLDAGSASATKKLVLLR